MFMFVGLISFVGKDIYLWNLCYIMSKILIASPVYDGMEYCFMDFISNLKAIDYSGFDILIIDNSRDGGFFLEIENIPNVKVVRDDTVEKENMFRVVSSRNKILDYAIDGGYDYLLMMDCDVMVPVDILGKLLSHRKDVVSGLYFNYFPKGDKVEFLPVCYKKLEEENFAVYKKFYPKADPRELSLQLTLDEVRRAELMEVSVPSGGCVLLSRKAFSSGARYGFFDRYLRQDRGTTDDIKFFKELRDNFKIYCDTSVLCKHDVKQKYRDNDGVSPFYG